MSELNRESRECLDELVDAQGPAPHAWYTRAHLHLERAHPGRCVFRLGEKMDSLCGWLDDAGIQPEEDHRLRRVEHDDDRGGPHETVEGGALAFCWQGQPFRAYGLRYPGRWVPEIAVWVVAPDREAGKELAEAVHAYTMRRASRVMVFEDGDWEEAPRLEQELDGFAWESLVLPEAMRGRLRRTAELFFQSESVYRDLGIPWKLGLLLVGPPGTGKTHTTKVLAATSGVSFLYVRGVTGSGENKPDAGAVREMFQGARERGPCILCLEDLDSLVSDSLRSTFLNELDGLEQEQRGVLTVATTNHPDRLDPALLHRPCRFDHRFEFPLPDDDQRRAFVHHWTDRLAARGLVREPAGTVEEIVRRSRGMSQAYLKRLLIGTVTRMHTLGESGDAAFHRIALEELADAVADRKTAQRVQAQAGELMVAGRVGFRMD